MNRRAPAAAAGGMCPLVVFLIDPGPAYCVPEAGSNYKRQMDAQISREEFLRIPRQ
jgi:hypothetical protein